MALNTIKGMRLNDGTTEFDVSALSNESLKKISIIDTDLTPPAPNPAAGKKNNLIIGTNQNPDGGTYGLKNTDLKAVKSLRFYTGSDEIKWMADSDSINESDPTKRYKQVHMKSCVSKELCNRDDSDPVIRMRMSCKELELNCKNAFVNPVTPTGGTTDVSVVSHLDLSFKKDNALTNAKIKASAIDVRGNAPNGKGSGGGIAVQIASCDGSRHENKFKIETDRKVDALSGLCPSDAEYDNYYNKEGGTGIEIGTINSQFESLGAKEIRRLASAEVFAVKRSVVERFDSNGNIITDTTTTTADKWDYVTQSDDSKDIKNSAANSVRWIDLINAALYLKANNNIPAELCFYNTWAIDTTSMSPYTSSSNSDFCVGKNGNYNTVISARPGYTLGSVTYQVGGGEVQTAAAGAINITGVTGTVTITSVATPSV